MANLEHVEVVKRGAAAIWEWRERNPDVVLDLRGANLTGVDLSMADLSMADLSGADLSAAEVSGADLIEADLSEADLSLADFVGADLTGADLSLTDLTGADFTGADLSMADLRGVGLIGASFRRSDLRSANLGDARVHGTTFALCDLSAVVGLETVNHDGPSSIGIDTLLLTYRGAGNRPAQELRGFFNKAGVPAALLDALPRIAGAVQYHSAFIAYGEPDRAFAERLYDDLQGKGVSCWMYAMDATPGAPTQREIHRKRGEAGKFIVLCSAEGLVRDGPKKEIEAQMDDDQDKIIPISLDDLWKTDGFEVRRAERDLKPLLLERNYADFSREAGYATAFERLLKALELGPVALSP